MKIPAYITTWENIREGDRVLVIKRTAKSPSSTTARIDVILSVREMRHPELRMVKARMERPPRNNHRREVEYAVERDMLVAVVDSDVELDY